MNPLVVVRNTVADDVQRGVGLWIWCPGCDMAHRPEAVSPTDGSAPGGPTWTWNGATDETFSIEPSLLVTAHYGGESPDAYDTRCHSHVRNGHWQFLSDCTHELAGRTVPMVPVPDWLVRESSE